MLGHYEVDATGHPEATNLSVPIIYPKSPQKYGDTVTYADSHSAHLETEFRFDVLQVAHRSEILGSFEQSIDFKVPRDFLEQACEETYGLKLNDLFDNYDVAINTNRWGFRTLINEGTGIAWGSIVKTSNYSSRAPPQRGLCRIFLERTSSRNSAMPLWSPDLSPGSLGSSVLWCPASAR